MLPPEFLECVQQLIRLEYLTKDGQITNRACSARKVAVCLAGIPPELMKRLLETGINSSLAKFQRFVDEAIKKKPSTEELAAKVRARARASGIAGPAHPCRASRARPARSSAQIALALDTDSATPLTFESEAAGASLPPRELRLRELAQQPASPATVKLPPSGKENSKRGRCRAQTRPRPPSGGAEADALAMFTLEDVKRVQEAAECLQKMADLMKQRLDDVENAQSVVAYGAAGAAAALDLDGTIEHLRELSNRGFDHFAKQLAAPVLATPADPVHSCDADWHAAVGAT